MAKMATRTGKPAKTIHHSQRSRPSIMKSITITADTGIPIGNVESVRPESFKCNSDPNVSFNGPKNHRHCFLHMCCAFAIPMLYLKAYFTPILYPS